MLISKTGLEAYWPLNEGAGSYAADLSGKRRDLTTLTNVGWYPSPLGSNLYFQDRSVARSAYGSAIDLSSAASFSVVWSSSKLIAATGTTLLICFGLASTQGIYVFYPTALDNRVAIRFQRSGTSEDVFVADMQDATLHDYGLTFTLATLHWALYKDGELKGEDKLSNVPVMPNRKVVIGNIDTPSAATGHVGIIGNVSIWSRSLTPDDMMSLHLDPNQLSSARSYAMMLTDRWLGGDDVKIHAYSGVTAGTSPLLVNDSIPSTGLAQDLPTFYGAYATGIKVDVSSSSANDAYAGPGTGARQVTIVGLGPNFVPQTEVLNLAGQTAATSALYYSRIFGVFVSLTGSGLVQAGDIYIIKSGSSTWAAGVPNTITAATMVCKIPVAFPGQIMTGYWTVPAKDTAIAGQTARIRRARLWSITPGVAAQNARLYIWAQPNLDTDSNAAAPWEILLNAAGGAPGLLDLSEMHEEFTPGTDIILKMIPLAAGAIVSADLHLRLT